MAGFLMSHGVLVALALASAMAVLAPGEAGAEPGHHVVDVANNVASFTQLAADGSTVEVGDANHPSNPIRMPTDEPKGVAMPNMSEQSAMLPQPDGTAKVAMPASTENVSPSPAPSQPPPPAAPAPSPSGSTSVTVSLLACVGMALLCLVVA